MRRNPSKYAIIAVLAGFFFFISCSTTKYIPAGHYLLEEVDIETEDKGIDKTLLLPYIQQKPNDSKLGLRIYNIVDNDSNWFKKAIRKIGEPPVVFNSNLVNLSVRELTLEMNNFGYLNAAVTAKVDTADKKATVTYSVLNNEPYRIRNYKMDFAALVKERRRPRPENRARREGAYQGNRDSVNTRRTSGRNSLIKEGLIFDMGLLEKERVRISSSFRNRGYYAISKDHFRYLADTTLQSNQVDLILTLADTSLIVPYTIEKVNVFSNYDPLNKEAYKIVDSLTSNGINIYYDRLHFLRSSVINRKALVRPHELFRESRTESAYSLFQSLNCVNRVNIEYVEGNYSDSTLLDCNIYLTPGNLHSLQLAFEGTNKAGDFGLAADVSYGHLNIFNGSEIFNMNFRGAYELVSGQADVSGLNNNYYELGFTPSLIFPNLHIPFLQNYMDDRFNTQTQYSLGYNIQRRPEYTRNFFNLNWKIRWAGQKHLITNTLSILDINYVAMPWKAQNFQDYLNNKVDSLTKYSYENIFTAGINYNMIYTNAEAGRMRQHLYTIRFNVETSGNGLNALFKATHASKNENGQYTIFGNPFAQYLKGDLDLAHRFQLNTQNGLAFHWALGVAYPYENSTILPFEKRYYAGGSNSVRGWSTRYLGPGSFNQGKEGDPTTHVGDISLMLSAEYRFKLISWLEPAFFIDAGNIWTIKDYPNLPGGYFQWDKFYKELAIGTGIGLRFDLSLLILRIDAGVKVYDPAQAEGDRWVLLREKFFRNSKLYFAIGYPF